MEVEGTVVARGAVPALVRPPVLEVRALSMAFDGARALDGIDVTIEGGEVHGLLGQNGSGKSTLIKILAGFHAPQPGGRLRISGADVSLPLAPNAFRALGLSFVHQDLALIPSLSVTENLRIRAITASRWRFSPAEQQRAARAALERFGLAFDPAAPVAELRQVERALLAIVRGFEEMREGAAGRGHSGLLVLDEPTAFLARDDTDRLFALIRDVVAHGASVLLVSHDLGEIKEITDRVTVLRDGQVVGVRDTSAVSEDELIKLIVGRAIDTSAPGVPKRRDCRAGVTVRGLSGEALRDISLDVGEGEVLGVTGLLGSGFEDLPYLLYGAVAAGRGSMLLRPGEEEQDLRQLNPQRAIELSIALVPADRQGDGAIAELTLVDNLTMGSLDRYRRGLHLRRSDMVVHARGLLERFQVRPTDPLIKFGALSGGNQQKVLLAKWFETQPRLLLLHEPTQGVDVAARQEIFRFVRAIAEQGTSVICASADHEQLAAISDRVVIVSGGELADELRSHEMSPSRISERCMGCSPTIETLTMEEEA